MDRVLSPQGLILVGGFVGLVADGVRGLMIGLVAGYILSLLIGLVLNAVHGGLAPPKERKRLAEHILINYNDVIQLCYPQLVGMDLQRQIEHDIEKILRKAVTVSPSNDLVYSQGVVKTASHALADASESQHEKQLYMTIMRAMEELWY